VAGWVHSVRLDCGPPSCRRQKLRQPLLIYCFFIYFYLLHDTTAPTQTTSLSLIHRIRRFPCDYTIHQLQPRPHICPRLEFELKPRFPSDIDFQLIQFTAPQATD
jgi:hypothetical protein